MGGETGSKAGKSYPHFESAGVFCEITRRKRRGYHVIGFAKNDQKTPIGLRLSEKGVESKIQKKESILTADTRSRVTMLSFNLMQCPSRQEDTTRTTLRGSGGKSTPIRTKPRLPPGFDDSRRPVRSQVFPLFAPLYVPCAKGAPVQHQRDTLFLGAG